MKTLYRSMTAALFALSLGITALADILPEPPEPAKTGSSLTTILIIAIAIIAIAVSNINSGANGIG